LYIAPLFSQRKNQQHHTNTKSKPTLLSFEGTVKTTTATHT
jgi:hypothetical protein